MEEKSVVSQSELFRSLYGSTQWGKVKESFIKGFKGAKNNEELLQACADMLPYLWYERSINTTKLRYSEIRNLIREIDGKKSELAMQFFSLPSGIYKAINEQYQEKVLANLDGNINLTEEMAQKVFDKMIEGYNSVDNGTYVFSGSNQTRERVKAYYLSIIIALATGRRQNEILKSLKIVKRKDAVIYEGISKKRDNDDAIEAPLLFIDVDTAKKYLHELRKCLPTEQMTTREVNQKYNHVFNQFLKKELGRSDISFHDIRGWYGELCYKKFAGENEDRNRFFMKVYGHKFDGVMPSEAYMGKTRS